MHAVRHLTSCGLLQLGSANSHGACPGAMEALAVGCWNKQWLHVLADAEKSGYDAIVVTVDAPFLGKREADERVGCALLSKLPHCLLAHT